MKYEDFENFVRTHCHYETMYYDSEGRLMLIMTMLDAYSMLNTAQREWQGLTDEELDQAMDYWSDPSRSAYGGAYRADGEYVDMKDTWRYIEAKLKEKNSG